MGCEDKYCNRIPRLSSEVNYVALEIGRPEPASLCVSLLIESCLKVPNCIIADRKCKFWDVYEPDSLLMRYLVRHILLL